MKTWDQRLVAKCLRSDHLVKDNEHVLRCHSKFVSGWCTTDKMTKPWDQRLVAKCPRRDHLVKDNEHVLRCQAKSALEVLNVSVVKLQVWMDTNSTCPEITKRVTNILTNFKSTHEIILHDNFLMEWVKYLMPSVE